MLLRVESVQWSPLDSKSLEFFSVIYTDLFSAVSWTVSFVSPYSRSLSLFFFSDFSCGSNYYRYHCYVGFHFFSKGQVFI